MLFSIFTSSSKEVFDVLELALGTTESMTGIVGVLAFESPRFSNLQTAIADRLCEFGASRLFFFPRFN